MEACQSNTEFEYGRTDVDGRICSGSPNARTEDGCEHSTRGRICFGKLHSKVIRKWWWLLVSGCEWDNMISVSTEFLNSCQDGGKCIKVLGDCCVVQ
jgi:hypothetical protein